MATSGKRIVGRIAFTVFFLFPLFLIIEIPIFLAGFALGTYIVYSRDLPEIPELTQYQPRTVSTFYADDGTVIGIFYKQKRFVVDLEQIPPHVVKAFLAAEDARFFEHAGVDWTGLGRAVLRNLKAGRVVQGGSTITMQVTRNFLLTREKRASRKIKEMILATRLEKLWGKEKILHIYLNEIYLGDGCYGVEAAARNYFDKPVEHLSVGEAALIAGLVASPARYNPFKNVEMAMKKRQMVLENMLRNEFITPEEFQKALREKPEFRQEISRPFDLVPDFAEEVRRYIVDKYGAESLYTQGLKVFTTCKVDYQRRAVDALAKGLEEIKARRKHFEIVRTVPREQISELLDRRAIPVLREGKVYQGVVTKVNVRKNQTDIHLALSKKLSGLVRLDQASSVYKVGQVLAVHFDRFVDDVPLFTLDTNPTPEGAVVVIENRTGYVRALVGGVSKEQFKFNRATQARRQPGSAFKPFIYSAAIEKRSYSPATIIVDEPIVVDLESGDAEWEPRNAAGDFLGPVSLRRALELSRNICTVKLLMDVGFDPVTSIAEKMGITSPLGRNLSLSLGTSEVTLFELTGAYTTFPNSGIYVQPTLVKRVEDRFGNVLEDNSDVPVLEANRIPHPVPREEFRAMGVFGPSTAKWSFDEEEATALRTVGPQALRETGSNPGPSSRPGPVAPSSPDSDEVDRKSGNTEDQRTVRAAISPQTAYIMTNLLQGGVRSGTGAGVSKYIARKDLAGKTGTTNHAEDAWFIGFTPDFTTGVWVGFDDKRPLGGREEGARAALPIWGYFMQGVLGNRPQKDFPVPPDITFTEMLTFTGNVREGHVPKPVREPVYTPFVGKTLILCPLDPPEILGQYGVPASPGTPTDQTAPGYPTVAPNYPGVSPYVQPGRPAQPLVPRPAEGQPYDGPAGSIPQRTGQTDSRNPREYSQPQDPRLNPGSYARPNPNVRIYDDAPDGSPPAR